MAIGTTAALIGASVAGGVASASSAKSAAKAQTSAANKSMDVQKQMYDQTRSDLTPFREAGTGALGAANFMLGLGAAPIIGGTTPTIETITTPGTTTTASAPVSFGPTNPRDRNDVAGTGGATTTPGTTQYKVGGNSFATLEEAQAWAKANPTGGTPYSWQGSPGYQWQLGQGQAAIDNSAASSGGLFSGATLKAQQEYGTGLANQDYCNNLNALMGLTTVGQNAAAQTGAASQNYANATSNALSSIGNAQAAGSIATGNAINSTINNGIGLWNYQNLLKTA